MAMQRKSSVMITVTTIPFWFDTIQIKRVLDDILMRHCIIIIIIIIIITLFQRSPTDCDASLCVI